ncbi:hypothetical protein SpCBS45565_g02292 [Spizellomyces sp. 'palustris']|nr:hypothetical protein SpCBS45565_g02292 [Spizellomyces sp. 'palustris']
MTSFWDPFTFDPFFSDITRPFGGSGDRDRWNTPLLTDTGNQPGALANTGGRGGALTTPSRGWEAFTRAPRLDVTETDKEYIIKADLPGLNKDEVKIHLDNDVLTIEGERKDEREDRDGDRFHIVERTFGRFRRSIRLPPDAQVDNVNAKMENGVLELDIPKNQEVREQRKKVDIQ